VVLNTLQENRTGMADTYLNAMNSYKWDIYRPYLEDVDSVLHIGSRGPHSLEAIDGWLHSYIDEQCETAIGIDINKADVESAQELGYDVRHDNAESFDLSRDDFEMVIAPDVIEHLVNPGQMFDQVEKHMSENGRFLLNTPNPISLLYVFAYLKRGSLDQIISDHHTMWFDEKTFAEFARRKGFEVVTEEPMLWERDAKSPLDWAFLQVRDVFSRFNRWKRAFSHSHFYVLKYDHSS